MIFAAAQTRPGNKNVPENLDDHYRLIKIAADHQADLIVFPEMSITGYLREGADKIAFQLDDSRLDGLRNLSNETRMIIVAGAPIQFENNLFIGSFIIHPDSKLSIYTKQYLHPGEVEYFRSSFNYNPIVKLDGEKISFAICVDVDNPLHPKAAADKGITVYISSIFFSLDSMENCHRTLSNYARSFSINILMSNFTGHLWGINAGGRSAFWSWDGNLIAELSATKDGLLVVSKSDDIWKGNIVS